MSGGWMVSFSVPGKPRGKGRHRSAPLMRNGQPVIGKGGRPVVVQHTDDATAVYENLVRLRAFDAVQAEGRGLTCAPVSLSVVAVFPVPPSWPKARRLGALDGSVHPAKKPDLDNVVKAVKDALNGVVWLDDSQVVDLHATKRYGEAPGLTVTVCLA